MDIGPEIERITVEPLEDPVPREDPAPTETPAEVDPEREAVPAGNLLTQPTSEGEQVPTRDRRERRRQGIDSRLFSCTSPMKGYSR
jgi:hypothetical protein